MARKKKEKKKGEKKEKKEKRQAAKEATKENMQPQPQPQQPSTSTAPQPPMPSLPQHMPSASPIDVSQSTPVASIADRTRAILADARRDAAPTPASREPSSEEKMEQMKARVAAKKQATSAGE